MSDPPVALTSVPDGYAEWLAELKGRIHRAQQRASLSVNRELVLLYWQIGRDILDRQAEQGWGAKVIDRLAHDLRAAFPTMRGFSSRNLKYMRAFAQAWPDAAFVQAVLAQLPWYHQLALLDKLDSADDRHWYAAQAMEHGWSRNVLAVHIDTRLRERQGSAITNFAQALPAPASDLARQILKDPYQLDFLGIGKDAQEREIERALINHITEFLLELGAGFAYVGRQIHLQVGEEDFFLDLLFYHLKLRCYVVIELKSRTTRRPVRVRLSCRGQRASSSASICSIVGRLVRSSSGSDSTNWYSDTPSGRVVSRSAYSATILSAPRHSKRPMVRPSASSLIWASTAVR